MAFLKKRGQVWYIYWRQGGKKHGKSLKTGSKAQAEEFLKEFEYRLSRKELGQQTDISLDALQAEYLDYSNSTKKQSTYERQDVPRVKRFVEFLHGQGVTTASGVTQAHVERYQQGLTRGLRAQTVRNSMYAASGLLTFAVGRGYLDSNVVRNVRKVKATKNPPRYLSHDEWGKVVEIAEPTFLWPLTATAFYAGLRNTELRFLTWPGIDFDNDLLTLLNKEGFSTKSHVARSIPLNRKLKAILLPLARPSGYCFLDKRGNQFDDDKRLSVTFKRNVVKPSGLPHFSLHTLRHSFASHLVMKGVSIYKVSQWLGHKDVSTTMIYAHLAPQDDEINVL